MAPTLAALAGFVELRPQRRSTAHQFPHTRKEGNVFRFFRQSRSRQQPTGFRRRRLCVEVLEDRSVPAILVNTLADTVDPTDHLTSLREAILQANSAPG